MSKKRRDKGDKHPSSEPGVRFELEADAENVFKSALEKISFRFVDKDREARSKDPSRTGVTPRKPADIVIDLHGMTVDAARRHVDDGINEILSGLASGATRRITIVTGKGLNSGSGGGVLAREIPEWVRHRFARHIVEMDESPADVQLGGIPLRGYFRVTIKG